MHGNTHRRLAGQIEWLRDRIAEHSRRIGYLERDQAIAEANAGAGLSIGGKAVVETLPRIDGEPDTTEINRAFCRALERARMAVQHEGDRPVRFARLRGFDFIVAAEKDFFDVKHVIRIASGAGLSVEPGKMAPGAVLRAINAAIDQIGERIARSRKIVAQAEAEIPEAKARLREPFAHTAALATIEDLRDQIEAQMLLAPEQRDRALLDAAVRQFKQLGETSAPTAAPPARKTEAARSVVARIIDEARAAAGGATVPEAMPVDPVVTEAGEAALEAKTEPKAQVMPEVRPAQSPARAPRRSNPRPSADPRQLSLLDAFF